MSPLRGSAVPHAFGMRVNTALAIAFSWPMAIDCVLGLRLVWLDAHSSGPWLWSVGLLLLSWKAGGSAATMADRAPFRAIGSLAFVLSLRAIVFPPDLTSPSAYAELAMPWVGQFAWGVGCAFWLLVPVQSDLEDSLAGASERVLAKGLMWATCMYVPRTLWSLTGGDADAFWRLAHGLHVAVPLLIAVWLRIRGGRLRSWLARVAGGGVAGWRVDDLPDATAGEASVVDKLLVRVAHAEGGAFRDQEIVEPVALVRGEDLVA